MYLQIERLIMQTSNVGNWVVGDNPSYIEKFGKDGLKTCSSDTVPLLEDSVDSKDDNSVKSDLSETDPSKNGKRQKCESDVVTDVETVESSNCASDSVIETGRKTEDSNKANATDGLIIDSEGTTVSGDCAVKQKCETNDHIEAVKTMDITDDQISKNIKSKEAITKQEVECQCDNATDNLVTDSTPQASEAVMEAGESVGKVPERLGYNERLMTISRNCLVCKNQYADPMPRDLLIYLHAVSYKVSL